MQVIFKIQVFNPDIHSGNLRLFRYLFPRSFLRLPMNRADTLDAKPHILENKEKQHQLYNQNVQLPDNE